jgi:hypothetical protein
MWTVSCRGRLLKSEIAVAVGPLIGQMGRPDVEHAVLRTEVEGHQARPVADVESGPDDRRRPRRGIVRPIAETACAIGSGPSRPGGLLLTN